MITRTKEVEKGFTLIELMIVVAFIAMLAAVAIPVYRDYMKKSKVSECNMAFTGFHTQATIIKVHKGAWPNTLSEIEGIVTSGNYISYVSYTSGVNPEFECRLKSFPNGSNGIAWLYTTVNGREVWTCQNPPSINTTLENKYLPKVCR
jgi:type IV pilus assembly protein PilA